jgi:hypothetical protein
VRRITIDDSAHHLDSRAIMTVLRSPIRPMAQDSDRSAYVEPGVENHVRTFSGMPRRW